MTLDGVYHCPHHPEGVLPEFAVPCPCRKPEPGMLLRAADELGLDLARSWLVGDFVTDAEAGMRAGCGSVLVSPAPPENPPYHCAPTTAAALEFLCGQFEEDRRIVDQ